jgi:hypothetical protein
MMIVLSQMIWISEMNIKNQQFANGDNASDCQIGYDRKGSNCVQWDVITVINLTE